MSRHNIRFSPLQFELTMILLFVVTLVLGLQGVYDYRHLKRQYARKLQENLLNIQNRLKESLPYPLWNLDAMAVSHVIQSEMAGKDVCAILIFDVEGSLYQGWARDKNWRVVSVASPPEGSGLLSARSVVSFRGEELGCFTVYLTDRFNKQALYKQLQHLFLVIALVDSSLSLFLFLLLRTVLLSPLVQMSHVLQKVAGERDFSLRLPETGRRDELGELQRSINLLLAEICRFQDELTRINLGLEDRIKERTRELEAVNRELVEARDRAEASARAKSQFLANMSHEIRTPMNAVIGLTELALQKVVHPKIRQYLEIVRSSSKSLLALLNDILDLSKVEAGKMELVPAEVDLDVLLEDVADMFKGQFANKNLDFVLTMAPDLPKLIRTDGRRVQQVLINLLGNALKFTEQGEVELKVEARMPENNEVKLLFQVRDTGVGVAPEHQTQLFDPFVQAQGGYNRQFGGSGLGLAISKRLVELLGGEIWVESVPEKGSSFYFTIQCRVLSRYRELPEMLKDRQVLVVERHPGHQQAMRQIFASFGLGAWLASSLSELPNVLADQACKPDLLVLDLAEMRKMQAGEQGCSPDAQTDIVNTISQLNIQHGLTDVPKILLASISHDFDWSCLETLGVKGVLAKPVSASRLFDLLLEIFVGRKSSRLAQGGAGSSGVWGGPVPVEARVLVVEDNPINQQVAREMLTALGVDVDLADSGPRALELLEHVRYDLVFMDVQMPGMDGLETTRLIRSRPGLTDLPVVAMTAHALQGDEQMCLSVGMNDYVSKPVDQEALKAVLEKWLGHKAVSQAARGETEGGSDADLPVLPGIDVSRGLDRVRGDLRLFLTLVVELGRQVQGFSRSLLTEGLTREGAGRLLHDLRGGCANLGADVLADKLERLERELAEGADVDWQAFLQSVSGEIDDLLRSAELAARILGRREGPARTELGFMEVQDTLQAILNKIQEMDPVGLDDLLADLACFSFTGDKAVGRQIQEYVSELTGLLDNFDFDRARTKAEELLRLIRMEAS